MSMADLTQFVTLLAAMSVAVERAVEVIKGFITPVLNKMSDNTRSAVLQVIAVVCGAIAAYMAKSQLVGDAIAGKIVNAQFGYVLIGLLTAGGSAFWNHVLDMIGALKSQKEQLVKAAAVTLPPEPQAAGAAAPPTPTPQAAGAAAGKP